MDLDPLQFWKDYPGLGGDKIRILVQKFLCIPGSSEFRQKDFDNRIYNIRTPQKTEKR